MFSTPFYPSVAFIKLGNSPALTTKRFSTWLKDKDFGVDGVSQDVLIQCHTFEVEQNITLGSFESKVCSHGNCFVSLSRI